MLRSRTVRAAALAMLGALGALGVGTPDARAELPPFTGVINLEYRAIPGCPDETSMREALGARLEPPQLDEQVRVQIVRAGGKFAASIDLTALTGERARIVASPTCDRAFVDAIALVIARARGERLYLDPHHAYTPATTPPATANAMIETTTTAEPPVVVDEPAPPANPPATPFARPGPPPREDWEITAHVDGVSGVGGVPEVGLGGEVGAFARFGTGFVELAGTRWMRSGASVQKSTVDVDLLTVAVRGGWAPELPIRAWGVVETGDMTEHIATPSTQTWTGVGAGFGVQWPISPRVRAVGSVEAVVAVQRPSFSGYRPWPLSPRAAFGLEIVLR